MDIHTLVFHYIIPLYKSLDSKIFSLVSLAVSIFSLIIAKRVLNFSVEKSCGEKMVSLEHEKYNILVIICDYRKICREKLDEIIVMKRKYEFFSGDEKRIFDEFGYEKIFMFVPIYERLILEIEKTCEKIESLIQNKKPSLIKMQIAEMLLIEVKAGSYKISKDVSYNVGLLDKHINDFKEAHKIIMDLRGPN